MEQAESSSMAGARSRARRSSIESAPPRASDAPTPTQSALRSIRSDYRDLKTEICGERDGIVRDALKFNVLIGRVDSLYKKVERPREQIADLEAVRDISACVVQYAISMQNNKGPTASDFCSAIVQKCQVGSGIDWRKLGSEALNIFGHAPGMSTMIGPMDIVPKQRKKPIARKREKPGPSTRPEEIEAVENQSAETDKNIEIMFKILRTHKRVQFEALVLNRKSFSQTIENIFALSFLVKDGRVQFSCQDGVTQIVPRNAPRADDRASNRVVNTQFVLRFDFQDWVAMQQKLGEGQELMPDRAGLVTPAAVTPIRKTSRNRAREMVQSQPDNDDEEEEQSGRLQRKTRRRLVEND